MLEIILGDVFKAIFGPTSSPNLDFFDILRSKWSELDLTAIDFSECDPVVDIYENNAIQNLQYLNSDESTCLPRGDFEELLKLSLLYLNGQDASEFAFRRPGAQHRARWMSTPIYAFKMYLLHSQLKLDAILRCRLKRFCDFVSIFYAFY